MSRRLRRPFPWERARLLTGLLLIGQGLLVVTRILDHEAPFEVGAAVLVLGALLVAWPAVRARARAAAVQGPMPNQGPRALLLALLGATAAAAVLLYNLLAASDVSAPEVAIVVYGAALVAAAARLDRRVVGVPVTKLVAYSFPLVLAPLGLFAVNAILAHHGDAAPLQWYVTQGLVAPMALALQGGGIATQVIGDTVRVTTPRGPLYLTVGLVCAGFYASVLFLGVFGLFAWESRTPPPRLAAYLGLGLVGLHAANVLRLILLGAVGAAWGGAALLEAHEHAGWVLFLAWTLGFWALVLRRFEGPARGAPPAA
jgi:exosortase/archaeosortase family protein